MDLAFPLVAGSRWSYTRQDAPWAELVLGEPQNGKSPLAITFASGEQRSVHLWHDQGQLWSDGPQGPIAALTISLPPRAVSTERVRCTLHFLDELTGLCPAVAGGPLHAAPGVYFGFLPSSSPPAPRQLVLDRVRVTAPSTPPHDVTLTSYRQPDGKAPAAALWQAYAALDPPPERTEVVAVVEGLLAEHPADAESVAAIVESVMPRTDRRTRRPMQALDVARSAVQRLATEDRLAVVRVALQGGTSDRNIERYVFAADVKAHLAPVSEADLATLRPSPYDDPVGHAQLVRILTDCCGDLAELYQGLDASKHDYVEPLQLRVRERGKKPGVPPGLMAGMLEACWDLEIPDLVADVLAVAPEEHRQALYELAVDAVGPTDRQMLDRLEAAWPDEP